MSVKSLAAGVLIVGWGLVASAQAGEPASPARPLANPLYAYCADLPDSKRRSLEDQAVLLKELGFAGVAHVGLGAIAQRLATLDRQGLALYYIQASVSVDPARAKYDPHLAEVISLVKGRPTRIWLTVGGAKPSDPAFDARGVEILREIASLGEAAGIGVALYPHTRDWIETVEDAIRVADKVDRKNVGVSFNLCHWLMATGWRAPESPEAKERRYERLEAVLKAAGPRLAAVTINGADPGGSWKQLIQPLDRGSFEVPRLLAALKRIGYTGPIGLMCYGIPGDAREHLGVSMAAWRHLCEGLPPSELRRSMHE